MTREWESLSIGAVYGGVGPRPTAWQEEIHAVGVAVMSLRGSTVSPLALNVVFHVPGELISPDYAEMRTGKFSRIDRTLMVQVPVPDMDMPPNASAMILAWCREAIDLAEEFALRRQVIDQPLDVLRRIVDDVQAELGSRPARAPDVTQTEGMTATNTYQPGVCNIGPAEIRQRRMSGYLGTAVAAGFLVLAFALGWPPVLRLLVFVPVVLAANGFLQAAFHFCVRFGTQGLFNFGDLGAQEAVHEKEYRRKDQRKAILIVVLSVAIAAAVALTAFLVPLP